MPSREIAARETKSPHTEYLSALTFSTEASYCNHRRITEKVCDELITLQSTCQNLQRLKTIRILKCTIYKKAFL